MADDTRLCQSMACGAMMEICQGSEKPSSGAGSAADSEQSMLQSLVFDGTSVLHW